MYNAITPAKLPLQTGGWAGYLGNVGLTYVAIGELIDARI
jgi:hypothetical protein